jgi:hypothetical protein
MDGESHIGLGELSSLRLAIKTLKELEIYLTGLTYQEEGEDISMKLKIKKVW